MGACCWGLGVLLSAFDFKYFVEVGKGCVWIFDSLIVAAEVVIGNNEKFSMRFDGELGGFESPFSFYKVLIGDLELESAD